MAEEKPETSLLEEKSLPSEGRVGLGASLLDRAKKATGQAASKADDLRVQAAERVAEVRDDVASRVSELKDASVTKLLEVLNDFNAALPMLREAGYTLVSVDLGLGVPPKVVASFHTSDEVSEEKVEQLLVECAEKRFTALLLKSLFQARKLQMAIKIAGLKPRGIAVEIGLVPAVTVKFA